MGKALPLVRESVISISEVLGLQKTILCKPEPEKPATHLALFSNVICSLNEYFSNATTVNPKSRKAPSITELRSERRFAVRFLFKRNMCQ